MVGLSKVKGLIIDLDGCLYLGNTVIKGAPEAIRLIRSGGYRVLFLTNNSTLTRKMYADKLRGMGIEAEPEEVLTSGVVAARYISSLTPAAAVLAAAEVGFTSEAESLGVRILGQEEWHEAKYVVAGLDRSFSYRKLSALFKAIKRGARFIATNLDPTYPTEDGFEPGAGSIVASIEKASGVQPQCVGKPSLEMNAEAFTMLGLKPEETAFVGDRLDTDVESARLAGSPSILVRTGAGRLMESRHELPQPDFVIESISALPSLLAGETGRKQLY